MPVKYSVKLMLALLKTSVVCDNPESSVDGDNPDNPKLLVIRLLRPAVTEAAGQSLVKIALILGRTPLDPVESPPDAEKVKVGVSWIL